MLRQYPLHTAPLSDSHQCRRKRRSDTRRPKQTLCFVCAARMAPPLRPGLWLLSPSLRKAPAPRRGLSFLGRGGGGGGGPVARKWAGGRRSFPNQSSCCGHGRSMPRPYCLFNGERGIPSPAPATVIDAQTHGPATPSRPKPWQPLPPHEAPALPKAGASFSRQPKQNSCAGHPPSMNRDYMGGDGDFGRPSGHVATGRAGAHLTVATTCKLSLLPP